MNKKKMLLKFAGDLITKCFLILIFFTGIQPVKADSYFKMSFSIINIYNSLNSVNSNVENNIYIDESLANHAPKLQKQIKEHPNYEYTAFHLFTHGRSGELFINGRWLGKEDIVSFFKRKINKEVIQNLNIYACEFAKGKKGLEAVYYLKEKLKINIAASTNKTGKKGDWILETRTGLGTNNILDFPMLGMTLQDNDGDGIDDETDIDDDNDGILDTSECENLLTGSGFDNHAGLTNGNNIGVDISPWIITSGTANIVQVDGAGGYDYGIGGPLKDANVNTGQGETQSYLDIFAGSGDFYQEFTIASLTNVAYFGYFSARDNLTGIGRLSLTTPAGTVLDTTGDVTIDSGGDSENSEWVFVTKTHTLSAGTYRFVVSMDNDVNFDEGGLFVCSDSDGDNVIDSFDLDADNDGIYDIVEMGNGHLDANNDGIIDNADTNSGANGLSDAIETSPDNGAINYTLVDSDSDGILDIFELDSDNDGCFDVIEAGFTDQDADGRLGGAAITFDAIGTVTSGVDGYTTPLDGDSDSVFDFQEAGAPLSIVSQPTNQSECENDVITFSVTTTFDPETSYQWQEFDGLGWSDIVEGINYNGTQTNTLSILNSTVALDGNRYRVRISNLAYACDTDFMSSQATLNIDPAPNDALAVSSPVICDTETATIVLSNSQSGVEYQLRIDSDDSFVFTAIGGTGGDLDFPVTPSQTTVYNILARDISSGCELELINKSIVTVNQLPVDNLVFNDEAICFGDAINLTLENSELGIEYQLRLDSDNSLVGTPIIGTGGDINFMVSPNVTTTYNILATNTTSSCSITQANKSIVTVNPLPVVNSIVQLTQCDDDTDGQVPFNLTEANGLISTNASNETFTYYITQTQAERGGVADQISNPITYENPIPITGSSVYARIETTEGCHRTARIDLEVGVSQIPVNFATLEYFECDTKDIDNDNTNGIATFDFSDARQTIIDLFPTQTVTVTFYNNEADALAEVNAIDISNHRNTVSPFVQNIYVRIDSDNVNACLGLGHHVTLTVDSLPVNNTIEDYVLCSDTNSATFDLNTKTADVIGSETRPMIITYHESEQDAINNIDIPDISNYNSTDTTIYVRAQFDDNNNGVLDPRECVSTDMSFELKVIPNPIVFIPEPIRICNDQVGTIYDLTIREDQITGGDTSIDLTYFESQTDLDNNNPIVNPIAYNNSILDRTILVLATGANMCTSEVNLELKTIIYDDLNLNPDPLEECEIDNDGFDNFDLRRSEVTILNGLNAADFTFSYYEDMNDAEVGNTSFIQDPSNFENSQINTQTLYVRVEPMANECFQIATIQIIVNQVPEIQIEDEYVICLEADNSVVPPIGNVLLEPVPIDTQLSTLTYSFQWYTGNEANPLNIIAGATDATFSPTAPENYTVIATNLNTGCTIPATTTVIGSYPPESITAEVTTGAFSNNDIIEVSVVGNGTYEFSLDNEAWQSSPTFENVRGGEHVVSVRDIYNCNELISGSIIIIDYPKFFTPNNDGVNDTWQIYGIANQRDAKIYIFDRYGKLLKQLTPNEVGWDGTFNGTRLPTSDYWFTIEYNDPNKDNIRKLFKAHFTLKR